MTIQDMEEWYLIARTTAVGALAVLLLRICFFGIEVK